MSNPLSKLGHILKVVAVYIAEGFSKLVGHDAAVQFGSAALHVLESQAGQIVLAVVQELSATNLSNAEKRDQAFSRIKDALLNAGLSTKDSYINLLIELAVSTLKHTISPA